MSGGEAKKASTNANNRKKKEVKKETGLGLSSKKDDNFGEWYSEVVVSGELIEYYDISGCYILRPWTMSIWEIIQAFFDAEIKKMKIKNCYFPLFVSPGVLQKEKDHIEGFAPEVAWVTKSGQSDLDVPIAIRPTSETVMYPYFSKWIRGHRDLPLKLNQWCNVVRWEFSNPTPFIRSREFLWQEGHTAFATKEEANKEVLEILELYRRIYEDYLAIPVIKGKKSEHEKFAGGLYTTSVEAFIPHTGRGIQGATSHCLGQNFAKMFEINFENDKGEKAMVWQNSWAYSTRTIGVMVMVHGDDKGLVLPPKIAAVQVIVIPVPYKDADTKGIFDACDATVKALNESGFRAESDFRDNYSPGWKYSHWEMKGVPLRIEIGPKDLANDQVRAVRRDNSAKSDIPRASLVEQVKDMLDDIQQSLFDVAKQNRDACVQVARTWDEFMEALNQKKMILAPWCEEEEVEKDVKARTKGEIGAAKTLCSPFEQPALDEGTLCFASGKPAKKWTYWGRSY
ncbi:proline--tRNA ligase, cytoplasmic isoform X2 [Actinidia eriantha]|uniref:proline--tRNA ligase, cytoplasmic isoform X2 n=1 Tax=Actinidia eriantha TaxID=165200 RepID=UPI002584D23F|nr:proline--tRNA ligase, cytoplasmic isoform X2 [Actinidia eriantha]